MYCLCANKPSLVANQCRNPLPCGKGNRHDSQTGEWNIAKIYNIVRNASTYPYFMTLIVIHANIQNKFSLFLEYNINIPIFLKSL